MVFRQPPAVTLREIERCRLSCCNCLVEDNASSERRRVKCRRLGGGRSIARLPQRIWKTHGRNEHMHQAQRLVLILMTLTGLLLVVMPASAADPKTDRLLRSPISKDWVTNGGNLT